VHSLTRVSIAYEPARCAVCGHADAASLAESDDIRAEVEDLWAFHERRLRRGIPIARLMDRVAFSEHPPWRLVRCRACGLVYRNPAERRNELTEIYARAAPTPETMAALHDTQLSSARGQARRLRAAMNWPGTALEVGSYVGAFLTAARDAGLTIQGLDINASVNAYARSRGFAVHDGDLTSLAGEERFDAVAIWNTFDQVSDPRATLFAAWRLLRRGGLVVIRVPNGGFYAHVRHALASRWPVVRAMARELLAQNNQLGFPYRWGFDERSLEQLLAMTGFAVDRFYGDVLVPIADEYTRPWARVEELLFKGVLSLGARTAPRFAPWLEVYARKL